MDKPTKPAVYREKHHTFLDDLRDSGKVNMLGAREELLYHFDGLSRQDVKEILLYWIQSHVIKRRER